MALDTRWEDVDQLLVRTSRTQDEALVRAVQEIIRATEITPVPRAPEFIKGVINLRGRIIPVVDLKPSKTLKPGAQVSDSREHHSHPSPYSLLYTAWTSSRS